jgi:hypothetical protein
MTITSTKPKIIRRIILITLFIVVIGLLAWGISWATYARPPLQEAEDASQSDDQVLISSEPWLTFTPLDESSPRGLIFYPGGRIDPLGYASLLRPIAEEGYLVVVPSMPINMAIFNLGIADEIIAHYSSIETWVIAGHSVGGTSAAMYTAKNPGKIAGLAIWASYPPNSSDLSGMALPVYSIYGELDPRVNRPAIAERKNLLPPNTVYVEITGGDHHQFGSYLIKPEEDFATIPLATQQEQIIQSTLELLNQVSGRDQ